MTIGKFEDGFRKIPVLSRYEIARFWSHIDVGGQEHCWPWRGHSTSENGYGITSVRAKTFVAHRVAYTLWHKDIPQGLTLDHLCRNRLCCNPKHLEAVTKYENDRRGNSPHAINGRKTHCPHGHPYSVENTRFRFKLLQPDKRGKRYRVKGRECLICIKAQRKVKVATCP